MTRKSELGLLSGTTEGTDSRYLPAKGSRKKMMHNAFTPRVPKVASLTVPSKKDARLCIAIQGCDSCGYHSNLIGGERHVG